ncbi:MAG: zinc ribbon domain-containing protein [Bryobacteraceae bacterium]
MLFAAALALILIPVVLTLGLRKKDLPEAPPVSPTAHLDQRKAQIYENLRDLQFEYRVGKLSDADYQQTKLALQQHLAQVLAEIEKILGPAAARPAPAPKPKPVPQAGMECPHCGAKFDKPMKFCGECGKAIA